MSLEMIGLLITVFGIFIVIATRQYFRTLDTIFECIEESKKKLDRVKDSLNKNYHNKDEMRDYINLLHQPIIQKISHIDTQLTELKSMFKAYIDKQ